MQYLEALGATPDIGWVRTGEAVPPFSLGNLSSKKASHTKCVRVSGWEIPVLTAGEFQTCHQSIYLDK